MARFSRFRLQWSRHGEDKLYFRVQAKTSEHEYIAVGIVGDRQEAGWRTLDADMVKIYLNSSKTSPPSFRAVDSFMSETKKCNLQVGKLEKSLLNLNK